MKMMLRGLSIIIVNYNGAKFLKECIHSYQEYLNLYEISHEFLLIDNASQDNSVEVINELSKCIKEIVCYFSDTNHGFSKANNIMSERARFSSIVFINNDTLTVSLDDLCKRFILNEIGDDTVYTCKILNADHTRQKNIFNYPKMINIISDIYLLKKVFFRIYKLFYNMDSQNILNGYFSGCYLVMGTELFLKVDGFDDSFFFYHEECDLFLRLEKFNIKKEILVDEIIHFGSGGSGISNFSFRNYYLNLAKLLIKHGFGARKKIIRIFEMGFKLRIGLLNLGIRIPYSPFSHIYQANKFSNYDIQDVVVLHKQTLREIKALNSSE